MKNENEVQMAWEIWILINRLNNLLWNRYEDDFIDIDLQEDDPCLGPLGPLGPIDAQDKKEG